MASRKGIERLFPLLVFSTKEVGVASAVVRRRDGPTGECLHAGRTSSQLLLTLTADRGSTFVQRTLHEVRAKHRKSYGNVDGSVHRLNGVSRLGL